MVWAAIIAAAATAYADYYSAKKQKKALEEKAKYERDLVKYQSEENKRRHEAGKSMLDVYAKQLVPALIGAYSNILNKYGVDISGLLSVPGGGGGSAGAAVVGDVGPTGAGGGAYGRGSGAGKVGMGRDFDVRQRQSSPFEPGLYSDAQGRPNAGVSDYYEGAPPMSSPLGPMLDLMARGAENKNAVRGANVVSSVMGGLPGILAAGYGVFARQYNNNEKFKEWVDSQVAAGKSREEVYKNWLEESGKLSPAQYMMELQKESYGKPTGKWMPDSRDLIKSMMGFGGTSY